ncbi:unnamed protein product [Didymodactylos carnosus]|uniref:Fucosyltransferase n=1 Tax=Didymodactylos carnosus TaxID=1234261 RepID=A0A8S2I716_9BILA|nr:unnamed protein product [Didymodactylos carnosus]CAF3725188.1 unnamed protein product [Didymodactylos carnosus]
MTELQCPFLTKFCDITNDNGRFSEADAVLFHMRDSIDKEKAQSTRKSDQRFVFGLWESPPGTPDLLQYRKFFNWTLSYRFDSHIISTYYFSDSFIHKSSLFYQLISKYSPNITLTEFDFKTVTTNITKRIGTAVALISNCGGSSRRLAYITQLRRYIDVQVYGRCGTACPANVNCREYLSKNFYFILSFENSLCSDYTTEKFFSSLSHSIVPVVYGRTNYSRLIPKSGFIDIQDFSTPLQLAQYLNETKNNLTMWASYFSWRRDYVWGINSFFFPFCDLCLRLHLDKIPNVIDDISSCSRLIPKSGFIDIQDFSTPLQLAQYLNEQK